MPSHPKRSFHCLLILKELNKVRTLRTKPFPPEFWYALVRSVLLMSVSDRIQRRALNSAVECHPHTLAIPPPAIDSKDVLFR